MPQNAVTLEDKIYSNHYSDLIVSFQGLEAELLMDYPELSPQLLGGGYAILHFKKSRIPSSLPDEIGYSTIPKLFTTLDTTSLEVSGILRAQDQPVLNLKGRGVLIGFIDTGIDYTLNAFRNSDGSSRILGLWDQTIPGGSISGKTAYGTAYSNEELNRALKSENPKTIIPSKDENGHGTFIAGVAAGSADPENNFIGAAPQCSIAMVKLKPAKQYLKDFFYISEDALAFQESDIMAGVYYLYQLALEHEMPLVICIGLGTNQGDHAGNTFLDTYISYYTKLTGIYCVVAAGNESGKGHHYYGKLSAANEHVNVEILVDSNTKGFSTELWANAPELYSIAITSPLGETIPPIPARLGQNVEERFILEKTVVRVDYEIVEFTSGSQLILIRFQDPTPGIWTIRVINNVYINGVFHMWLPITGLIPPETVFLAPNPDVTLTTPSPTSEVISTSAYNAYDNSLFINSSRGFTRTGGIKPDIAAPGVNVYGPNRLGRYVPRNGSSVSAAITSGAVALMVEWGMKNRNPRLLTNTEVKNYLIRGARRSSKLMYPNREWGYGTLDVYNIFESLQ